MICAPTSRSSAGDTAFTVPCVPTGMKIGVSITPCRVSSRPRRAFDCGIGLKQGEHAGRGA